MHLLSLLSVVASAEPGAVDLHGPPLAAPSTDPAAPLRTGAPLVPGTWSLGLGFEYAREPVVRIEYETGISETVPVLAAVGLAHLAGAGAVGRFGLAVDLPVGFGNGELGNGGVVGDAALSAPIALWPGHVSFGPTLRVPVGSRGRYVGDDGFGAGLQAVGAATLGRLTLGLDLAAERRTTDDPLLDADVELRGAAAVGLRLAERVGLHLELVSADRPESSTTPASELGLGARLGRGRVAVELGGATAVAPGPGASSARLLAGITWAAAQKSPELVPVVVAPEPVAPAPPAVVRLPIDVTVRDIRGEPVAASVSLARDALRVDAAPVGAGVYHAEVEGGAWELRIEAPGLGAQVRPLAVDEGERVEAILLPADGDSRADVSVADLGGRTVESARLLVDGLSVGSLGSGGAIGVSGLGAGPHALHLDAYGFRATDVALELGAGSTARAVTLAPVAGTVRLRARTQDGAVADAWVAFDGPIRREPTPIGASGERTVILSPGRWLALVTSEGHGAQTRELLVEADDYEEAVVDVVFLPQSEGGGELDLRLVDPDGRPIPDAEVRVDGVVGGATSSGGTLALRDLQPGMRRIDVSASRLGPVQRSLPLDATAREEVIVLEWDPGTTRLAVRHPEGPVTDAVVEGSGPGALARQVLPPNGIGWVALGPGDWTLLATSEGHGALGRRATVAPPGRLTEVDFVLSPPPVAPALSALTVEVTDAAGRPADGVDVGVDGSEPRGETTAGRLEIPNLLPGARTLVLSGEGYGEVREPVTLRAGPQAVSVKVPWRHAVRVAVVGPDGAPAEDAVVRLLSGGTASSPRSVGPGGECLVPAAPGDWQVVVTSVEHGLGTATVAVAEDTTAVDVRVDVGRSGASDLLVLVQDPLGRPVERASVGCVGCPVVSPGAGGAVLVAGLAAGPTALRVSAPNHQERSVAANITTGDEQRVVRLEPIPGKVTVKATDAAGKPVAAEIRFAGPYAHDPTVLGPSGADVVELLPGQWDVSIRAEGFGAQSRRIEVGEEPALVEVVLEPARVEVAGGQVVIEEQVHFDLGKAELRPESTALLAEVASTIAAYPDLLRVEVQGHTDTTGDLVLNQALSQARADAVMAALVARGVASDRLVARGYGPTRPVAPNDDDAGRGQNRRVQFEILEQSP